MKKTLMTGVFLALSGVVLSAGGAMAIPTGADYWERTDLTTGTNGKIGTSTTILGPYPLINTVLIPVYNASGTPYLDSTKVGSFGLFYDLDKDKAISAEERFKVINGSLVGSAVILDLYSSTYFNNNFGSWDVAAKKPGTPSYNPMTFNNVFGFYFSDVTNQNYYYTDTSFNVDQNKEYITIDYTFDEDRVAISFFKDGYNYGGNNLVADAIVRTNNVAPVPEPATMLLLGTGLVGLAGTTRKRMKKA